MDRAEAIERFEKQLTAAQVVLDSGFGTNPGENNRLYVVRKEMAAIALEALREQEALASHSNALETGKLESNLKALESKLRVLESKWISVSERLPEDGVRVLTACDDGVVRLGISKGGFPSVVNRSHRFSDVTNWMPLPEPPKEDE